MCKSESSDVHASTSQKRWIIQIDNYLPPTLNAITLGKRRQRVKLSKSCKNMIAVYAYASKVPAAEGKRRVWLRFDHAPGVRRPDVDSYFKATLDALKTAKVIVDDSPKWVDLEKPVLERGPINQTTIIVEDI